MNILVKGVSFSGSVRLNRRVVNRTFWGRVDCRAGDLPVPKGDDDGLDVTD